jgi:hypothetical protein
MIEVIVVVLDPLEGSRDAINHLFTDHAYHKENCGGAPGDWA